MTNKNHEYYQYMAKKWAVLFALAAALLLSIVVALSVGSAGLPLVEILQVMFGGGESTSRTIIFNIRMPRIATGMAVGISLAMAGCIMQSVLRNPLASASTLGISQGASFGAAVAIVYFEAGMRTGIFSGAEIMTVNPFTTTAFAFIGGISTTILILLLSYRSGADPATMILAGVAIGAMFTGATAMVQYFADDVRIGSIVYWTFGNLGRPGWREIRILSVLNAAGFLYFIFNRWNYNAMESGPHTAKSLGVNVDGLVLVGMAVATLISATAIAFVGTISFIGLIAPHIVRKFVGNDYRFLIPGSALMGGTILIGADIASRMIRSPAVLPIGAFTSFLGAPLFLYLIINKGKMAK